MGLVSTLWKIVLTSWNKKSLRKRIRAIIVLIIKLIKSLHFDLKGNSNCKILATKKLSRIT